MREWARLPICMKQRIWSTPASSYFFSTLMTVSGSPMGKGTRLNMVGGGLVDPFLLHRRYGKLVGIWHLSSLPRLVEFFRLVDEPLPFRARHPTRLLVVLADMNQAQGRHLVVDKTAHRIGGLDRFTISADPFLHLAVAAQVEAEHPQPHFTGGAEAVRLAACYPHGRVGLLHRLGNYRSGRDSIKLAFVGESVSVHILGIMRTASSHCALVSSGFTSNPSISIRVVDRPVPRSIRPLLRMSQHRGPLCHPHRMVVLAWQQRDGVADADALGALGDGAVQNFRSGTVGELCQEVGAQPSRNSRTPLRRPGLPGQHLLVPFLLNAGVVRFRNLDFVHQAKFHVAASR